MTFKRKHGHRLQNGRKSSEYVSWQSMKTRCLNANSDRYLEYGAEGIGVCNEWAESFERFLDDMGVKPSPHYTLDRIDPNKGYSPDNCRWASPVTQSRNKKGLKGVTRYRNQWRVRIGVPGGNIFLGHFEDMFEAICARKSAENSYWGSK